MTLATIRHYARASVLALSLTVLPLTPIALAQTPTPTPETRVETRSDERDNTGLWGLLGLLGLAGLMGLRRPENVRVYDNPNTPRTETRVRP